MIKFSETKLAHYSMLLIDIEREKPFSKKKKKKIRQGNHLNSILKCHFLGTNSRKVSGKEAGGWERGACNGEFHFQKLADISHLFKNILGLIMETEVVI